MDPSRARPPARPRPTGVILVVGLLLLTIGGFALTSGAAAASGPSARSSASAAVVQVSATSTLSFVPATLSVTPGQSVELIVTQLANFNHTFVLSSVANFSFDPSATPSAIYAYFNAHPPLVNLSLGSVPGAKYYANFTAPVVGSYEFVCEIPTHFQGGMFGEMNSGTPSASSSSSVDGTTELIAVGVVLVVVGVIAVVLVLRRRRSPPPVPPAAAP